MSIPGGTAPQSGSPAAESGPGPFEQVGQTFEDYSKRAIQAGQEGLEQGQRMLRDNPAVGVLAAFAVGFVLGLILKR